MRWPRSAASTRRWRASSRAACAARRLPRRADQSRATCLHLPAAGRARRCAVLRRAMALRSAIVSTVLVAARQYPLRDGALTRRRWPILSARSDCVRNAPKSHNNRGNALWELRPPSRGAGKVSNARWRSKPDYAEALIIAATSSRAQPAGRGARRLRARAGAEAGFRRRAVNRGNALARPQGRTGEAIASYDAALALSPKLAEAHWNKALPLLVAWRFRRRLARITNGAGGAEARCRRAISPQPQWRGEEIAGKTILLHAEQGFGDTIQFVRYAADGRRQRRAASCSRRRTA